MPSPAVVDTGPLLAALDRKDPDHDACVAVLRRRDLHLVVPTLVVAEVTYFAARRLGTVVEAGFLRGLGALEVEAPLAEDWPLIADLVEQYAGFPLGTIDASVIVLADRLATDLVITLDRRHFGAVVSPAGRRFRLLPEAGSVHEEASTYAAEP